MLSLCVKSEITIDYINKIIKEFSLSDLDDFYNDNVAIFNYEEKGYLTDKAYTTLSLLSISFFDLGILNIE